jgi:hypothetical protein
MKAVVFITLASTVMNFVLLTYVLYQKDKTRECSTTTNPANTFVVSSKHINHDDLSWIDTVTQNDSNARKRHNKNYLDSKLQMLKISTVAAADLKMLGAARYLFTPQTKDEPWKLYKHNSSCTEPWCDFGLNTIENGVLYGLENYHQGMYPDLSLAKKPIDFIARFHDDCFSTFIPVKKDNLPIFGFCTTVKDSGFTDPEDTEVKPFSLNIAIPDGNLMSKEKFAEQKNSLKNLRKNIRANHVNYPWNKKIRKAMWRGTSTFNAGRRNFEVSHRRQLALLAKNRSDIIDANFTNVYGEFREQATADGICCAQHISQNDFQSYVAILDLDGNAWSSRFSVLMQMSSVIIKQQSPDDAVDFFQDKLKPWVHFVPMKADLSDLEEKVQWVLDHEQEARQIVRNANIFALTELNYDALYRYWVNVLNSYAGILEDFVVTQEMLKDWELLY